MKEYRQNQRDVTSKNLKEEWTVPSTVAAHQARFNWYLDWLEEYLEADYHYLDLGCRNGEFLVQLRERVAAWRLWGVEIHEEAAMIAGDRGIATYSYDIHNLSFSDDYFDFVFLQHILEHTHNPKQVLSEAKRVTKPGGKLFIEVPLEPKSDKIPTIWGHWHTFQNTQMLLDLIGDQFNILKREEDPRKKWSRVLLEKRSEEDDSKMEDR